MIDAAKFTARRKALGLSQTELSAGICTQSTLSKFECNKQVPSLKILSRLCDRLGMSLDQLGYGHQADEQVLQQLVRALTREAYPQAMKLLQEADHRQWGDAALAARFAGLQTYARAVTNQSWSVVLAAAAGVLGPVAQPKVVGLLTKAALAILLDRHGETAGASVYTRQISQALQPVMAARANLAVVDAESLLLILMSLAEIAYQQGDYLASLSWLNQLEQLADEFNSTDCLARARLLAAKNALANQKQPSWRVTNQLNDALAFARLHHNQTVAVQAAALLKREQL